MREVGLSRAAAVVTATLITQLGLEGPNDVTLARHKAVITLSSYSQWISAT